MIRAVLDANVYASGLMSGAGVPGRILDRLLDDRAFLLCASTPIIEEVERVLAYPKVRRRIHLTDSDLAALLDDLWVVSELAPGALHLRVVAADPTDDRYLETAAEVRADYLVTGDKHLLELERYRMTEIVTPRTFLTILAEHRSESV